MSGGEEGKKKERNPLHSPARREKVTCIESKEEKEKRGKKGA